jgi:cytolysin (calcineurin-like family phosphatase)
MVRDPYHSLDLLIADLEENVGDSCRPVIVMSHYGFDGPSLNSLWWNDAQRAKFLEAAQAYNIIAYIHGHHHNTSLYTWQGIDMFNVGSPYYNAGENPDELGHFSVFRIHDDTLEAADVGWDPNDSEVRGQFVSPTTESPNMGWRLVKTFQRACE